MSSGLEETPSPILEVRDLTVSFAIGRAPMRRRSVNAVRSVSMSLPAGKTLAIVGESGSGKTTLARTILGLEKAARGRVVIDGKHVVDPKQVGRLSDVVQAVFQDSSSALDPHVRVLDSVAEPLLHKMQRKAARRSAASWLERVGIAHWHHEKLPQQLSGGQRQRVGIARAIAPGPRLLIADEPLSALDVSLQAQLVGILEELRDELRMSMLFVSHDLGVVRHISDLVGVMYMGDMVEFGPTEQVFAKPRHPYTRALLDSIPDPRIRPEDRVYLPGDISSTARPQQGCLFTARCPLAQRGCRETDPIPVIETGPHHWSRCLYPGDVV